MNMKATKLLGVVGLVIGSYSLGMAQSTTQTATPATVKTEASYTPNKETLKKAVATRQSSVQLMVKQQQLIAQPVRTREDLKKKEKTSTK